MEPRIKIYTCMRMTGQLKSTLVRQAYAIVSVGSDYGFTILNPVIEENVQDEPEYLEQTSRDTLERFWRRDKELMQEADVILDVGSCNLSDGVNVEFGYGRFCLWKPTVRIWPGAPINISQLESDAVVDDLVQGFDLIKSRWGTYEKLKEWREDMWDRSFPKWLELQRKMNERYGI